MLELHSVHRHRHVSRSRIFFRRETSSTQERTKKPRGPNLPKALLKAPHLPPSPTDSERPLTEKGGQDASDGDEEETEEPNDSLSDEATGDEITRGG